MWQISRIIGFGFLAGVSAEDIRTRKVPGELLVMMAVLAAVYQIWMTELTWKLVLGGFGMGILFLFISYITREALGYGDSILICILGIFVGAAELIEILMLAWMSVAVVSMMLLMKRRVSKKTSVPFIPFLLVGYCIVSIGTYLTEAAEV